MLQEFYRRAHKIRRLETAQKMIHAGKSTPVEVSCEAAQAWKSTSTKKNKENKKHKSGDRQWSLDTNNKKAKSPD